MSGSPRPPLPMWLIRSWWWSSPAPGDVLQFLEGGDHGDSRSSGCHQGGPGTGRAARSGRSERRSAFGRRTRHGGRGGVLDAARKRDRAAGQPASTSIAPGSTWRRAALPRSWRAHALAEFTTEHGEQGLQVTRGGRRSAARWLAEQPAGLDVPALILALEAHGERSH